MTKLWVDIGGGDQATSDRRFYIQVSRCSRGSHHAMMVTIYKLYLNGVKQRNFGTIRAAKAFAESKSVGRLY